MTFAALGRGTLAAVTLVLCACTSQVELLGQIPEAEANEVLAALANSGLRADKVPGKEGMVKLVIDQSQVARAITVLSGEGLPRPRYATMGDVFRKEGLISSPLEERARYLWALSQELSATVAQIDGVLTARVHVVLPERSSGSEPAMPSSAAVFIKHQLGYHLQSVLPQVRQLVSNSIPGLAADKVSVVLVPAQPRPSTETSTSVGMPAGTASAQGNAAGGSAPPRSRIVLWSLLGMFLLLALGGIGYVVRSVPRRSRSTANATATEAST
jgi:type III secretion protein J